MSGEGVRLGAQREMRRRGYWIGLGVVLCLGGLALWQGNAWLAWLEQERAFLQDEERLEAWIQELGWVGPLVLIGLNALQIVVAPIPAYGIYAAAGFLYGWLWGGIYGAIGMLLGVALAMGLARYLGRPVVERLVGPERLSRWESVLGERRLWIWALLLLAPIGDLPYFLAGLARVNLPKMLLLTLVIRVPTVFVLTAAGDQVGQFPWRWLAIVLAFLVVVLALAMRYQERWLTWFERRILGHGQALPRETPPSETEWL